MVSICRSEVPSYLHHSRFYCALDATGRSSFTVPADCFKKDTCISSMKDFHLLLRVMQYWMLDLPPQDVIAFVLIIDHAKLKQTNPDTWELFISLDFSKNLIELQEQPSDKRIELAVRKRMPVLLVRNLVSLRIPVPNNMCTIAVQSDNIELLSFLLNPKTSFVSPTSKMSVFLTDLAASAAKYGHVSCLQVLRDVAVARNSPLCLQSVHEHGAPWSDVVTEQCAANNSMQCLQYALDHSCPITTKACAAAALNGRFEILKYLHSRGVPLDASVPAAAARGGHFHCLNYLHEQHCPWSEEPMCMILCLTLSYNPRHQIFQDIALLLFVYRGMLCTIFPVLVGRNWVYVLFYCWTATSLYRIYAPFVRKHYPAHSLVYRAIGCVSADQDDHDDVRLLVGFLTLVAAVLLLLDLKQLCFWLLLNQ